MILAVVILALVTGERIAELPIARRNTRRLLASGGSEHARGHYPAIVAVHVAWLAILWWFGLKQDVQPLWLGLFMVIELGRLWVMATLGARWTTRIIIVPGEQLVRSGPYRFVNHPNYWVVAAEIAVLPLVFGLWRVALLFTLLNAAVLAIRIRAENAALSACRLR